MKTSIYNKAEHIEGYVKTDERESDQNNNQATQANEGNEVSIYGKSPDQLIEGNPKARDGYDNSGTQGKDSLSDDAYNSRDKNPTVESAASGTGSAGSDFETSKEQINEADENHALNTGI